MLSFLHPGFLVAAGAAALGMVALHFLVREQPRAGILPTVRFLPDVDVRATSLAIRFSDVMLLVLRASTILLIGAAFAQPRLTGSRRTVARVVAVDVSRNVGDMAELRDSVSRYAADAMSVIYFDSSLSTALITAFRAAARLRDVADSVELVVVSPFTTEESDAATLPIRSLWPGGIRAVRVSGPAGSPGSDTPQRLVVEWADSTGSQFWNRRARPDTVGAVRAGSAVVVHPFVRRWRLTSSADPDTRVFARWIDGEPAGVERITGGACVRSIAVSLPSVGDAILRPDFARFLDALTARCGEVRDPSPLPAAFMRELQGPSRLAASAAIEPLATRATPIVPWLLAAALALTLAELVLRRKVA